MAVFDLLRGDGFSLMNMTSSIQNIPYLPTYLGDKNIFTPKPVRTEMIAVEENNGLLSIIQTSQRGAPVTDRAMEKRTLRYFPTNRIARKATIMASSLAFIRAFGSESEFKQVADEVISVQTGLARGIALTKERMRLGAIRGIVLDADGTVIRNWYTEFGVTAPATIAFAIPAGTGTDTGTGAVYTNCQAVITAMMDAAKNMWLPNTEVEALCGATFFDKLVATNETRANYRAQLTAQATYGNISQKSTGAYATFDYAGIRFVKYRGSSDGTVAVAATEARFYPVGADPDLFQQALSPAESFAQQGQLGQDMYSMIEVDPSGLYEFVCVHARSYPLFMCTRPLVLQVGSA